jgi:hypothetical protein
MAPPTVSGLNKAVEDGVKRRAIEAMTRWRNIVC